MSGRSSSKSPAPATTEATDPASHWKAPFRDPLNRRHDHGLIHLTGPRLLAALAAGLAIAGTFVAVLPPASAADMCSADSLYVVKGRLEVPPATATSPSA